MNEKLMEHFTDDEKFRQTVEDLIDEIERSCRYLEICAKDYWSREKESDIKTRYIMMINNWESPFIACTNLLKIIESDEKLLKKICNSENLTFKDIGFAPKAKDMNSLIVKIQCHME